MTPSIVSRSCVVTRTIAPASPQIGQSLAQRRRSPVVEAGERLVEEHQPRLVQQCALERESLAHAAREAGDRLVTAMRQLGALERIVDRAVDVGDAVERPKKSRFSAADRSG